TAYICTTPVSPALAAGALAALGILQSDTALHKVLRANIQAVREILLSHNIHTNNTITPIFAFTIGDDSDMQSIEHELLNAGILLPLMRYPNGPAPLYFRLAVNAMHTDAQLTQLDHALTKALACENAS
ncbi:MAG: aminotransferase class I/II-fold pyridoxal phosphate-dependent enzyme, partial [Phycisphaerales bacterium]|nr:aminotransferase class I/II-fold pyridoxal phosphate-dependent enzyme [Phycisphaerales bacterium]